MAKRTVIGTDQLRAAMMTKVQGNDDELYALPAVATLVAADVTYLQAVRAAIAVANLMDKSAIETITGAWNFTAQPTFGTKNILSANDVKIPNGLVIMWSGLLSAVPSGWVLCDGNNGTQDMQGLFVKATASLEEPGTACGQDTYTLDTAHIPAHNHSTNGVSGGAHTHGYDKLVNYQRAGLITPTTARYCDTTSGTTGSSSDHSHTFTLDNAGEAAPTAVDNRPAFYDIAFIMKT